jgi:glucose-1-phosphate thymidylyltransferase
MRGIILAGGTGSSRPLAHAVSHPLMPVHDKPMIYYPLSTLMLAGIREVLVISDRPDGPALQRLLRDGSHLGLAIRYAVQPEPRGIAHAFVVGAGFAAGHPTALTLGDTLLHGPGMRAGLAGRPGVDGAHILAHRVHNPGEYCVAEIDRDGNVLSLEDRPRRPRSDFAVPGLYFYDASVVEAAARLHPRPNGHLEIADLNEQYRLRGALRASLLGPETAWLDTGTFDSLAAAGEFVRTVEVQRGHKIGCIEEIAWRQGWIGDAELAELGRAAGRTGYGEYLRLLAGQRRDHTVIELPARRRTAATH